MDVEYNFRPAFTLMTANLGPGESLKIEPGAMVAQSRGVDMKTGMGGGGGIGGFLKSVVKSAVGGVLLREYIHSWWLWRMVSLAPSAPGDIMEFTYPQERFHARRGHSWLVRALIWIQNSKGEVPILEGAFFLRAHAPRGVEGKVLHTSYGAIKEIDVSPNAPVVVDNGHVVAFTTGLSYNVSKVGGLGSAIFGGEGIVLEFNGSGKVYIQTRNMESLATRLMPFMPTARSN